MKPARSEARKATASAISDACPARPAGITAGFVDQTTHTRAGLAEPFALGREREVTPMDRHRDAVLLAQPLRRRLEERFVAGGKMQVAAFRRHELGDDEADALRGAGDQDGLAFEVDVHS